MQGAYELPQSQPVAGLGADARARFLGRTYAHLLGAIAAFTFIEYSLFSSGLAETIARAIFSTSWLIILGGFMIVSWFATRAAHTAKSQAAQYAALAAMVVAESIIFVPLLYVANSVAGGNVIRSAAIVTLLGFAGLTAIVVKTGKDFSFLRSLLLWGGVAALLLIVASVLFTFSLGTAFSVAMIAFAGAAILYDTSNVLREYPEDRYVAASLQLFASVALLFWYVLRLMSRR